MPRPRPAPVTALAQAIGRAFPGQRFVEIDVKTGVSVATLSRIQTGIVPNAATAAKLAPYLGMTPEEVRAAAEKPATSEPAPEPAPPPKPWRWDQKTAEECYLVDGEGLARACIWRSPDKRWRSSVLATSAWSVDEATIRRRTVADLRAKGVRVALEVKP